MSLAEKRSLMLRPAITFDLFMTTGPLQQQFLAIIIKSFSRISFIGGDLPGVAITRTRYLLIFLIVPSVFFCDIMIEPKLATSLRWCADF